MNMHMIEAQAAMRGFGIESKLNPDPAFLDELKALGRAAAGSWLDAHFEDIGERSTIDIADRFL